MTYTPGLNGGRVNATIGGNTAGVGSLVSTGTIFLAGGNNVTLSQNANSITISGASQSVQTQNLHNLSLSGNTSGAMAQISSGTLTLAGGNNITLSQNNNAVTISAASQSVQTQNLVSINGSVGNMSLVAGSSLSSSSNGSTITFGLATNITTTLQPAGNYATSSASNVSGVIAGSASNAATNQSIQLSGGVSFSNANNVSFFTTASNAVSGLAASFSQSNQQMSIYAQGNTYSTTSATVNASAMSFVGSGVASVGVTNGSVMVSVPSGGGGAGTNTFGMSNIGNTSGDTGVITGTNAQFILAGGNNITLSQSTNGSSATITISGSQSAQTQNLHNVTLSGNTAGVMAHVSSGTLTLAGGNNITLSQNGNAVTISAANGGGADGYNAAQFTNSTANSTQNILWAGNSNGSGNITFGLTGSTVTGSAPSGGGGVALYDGANSISSGTARLSNSNGITFGVNGQTITASHNGLTSQSNQAVSGANGSFTFQTLSLADSNGISWSTGTQGLYASVNAAGGGVTLSRYQNMDRGTTAVMAFPYNTLFIQRLNQENDLFAGNMTVSTLLLNISGSVSTGASSTQTIAAHTISASLGIYQPVATANTVLTLINSVSTTFGSNTTMSVYPYYQGNRWLSFHSSQWSSSPAFSQNQDYVFAVLMRSSSSSTAFSFIGQSYMNSQQRSGYWGVSTTSGNTTMPHGNYWNAMYSTSTTALPTNISGNQVNRNNATAIFIPHLVLNNQYTY